MVNLVALQMTSAPSVEENLDTVANEMASAKIEKNSLVVLPECFAYFGGKDKGQLAVAFTVCCVLSFMVVLKSSCSAIL